ncbi:MAG: MarR family transcriptional regulator [Bacteroidia bacterium]|nr:MarR family transcriptional regulator [Bacteroidia bacterium]
MKLEDAIQQKTPFKSPIHKAVVNIIYTHNWLVDQQRDILRYADITPQQYNVLRILRGQRPNPISTSDIRDRMLDRMSDVSRIVARLMKKNLVIRRTCNADKRLVDVLITDEGMALLDSIDTQYPSFEGSTLNLSPEEAHQLNELLDKMRS